MITCEVCKNEKATSLSFNKGKWVYSGDCTKGTEDYYITFDRLKENWIDHLLGKEWFEIDEFSKMLLRLIDEFRSGVLVNEN